VPRTTRERTVSATADEVWEVLSDPWSLPRWWPHVVRVEDVEGAAWTEVLRTPRGRSVRADFTRTAIDAPRRIVWRQELEESPFERILSSSVTEIELSTAAGGGTIVAITLDDRLRGMRNRLGWFIVGRAARRRLDEALDGLERAVGRA
jgi:uncharacterized protein YndB with AHSA1/START domain